MSTPVRTRAALPYVGSVAIVAATTAVGFALGPSLGLEEIVMSYLLAIMLVAVRFNRGAAVLAAALSVAMFDFFFVPPAYTFAVKDPRHLLTFAVMFAVGIVISSLTERLRRERELSESAAIKVRSEELRGALLSAVSHDLRTPLATITATATRLRDDERRISDEERRELVASICDEAAHLEQFVSNLLDMTRVQAGMKLEREWVPLEELIGAALTRLERQLAGRPVKVTAPDEPLVVDVDPAVFVQVFVNILENAVKYTPPGTPIDVRAEATDGRVLVLIEDRGPGLPPGDEAAIFEKFTRGRHVGIGGVGLGLSIARGIAEAHGARVTATNREGGGARFVVDMPGLAGASGAVPDGMREATA